MDIVDKAQQHTEREHALALAAGRPMTFDKRKVGSNRKITRRNT